MRFNVNGDTVVISNRAINGYTLEKVRLAKQYLDEIGKNKRSFPIERLVEMYNNVKGTHDSPKGCRPCAMTKYYNGLQTYYTYGKLTLISTNKATEDEIDNVKKAEVDDNMGMVSVEEEKIIDIPDEPKTEEPKTEEAPKAEKPKKAVPPKSPRSGLEREAAKKKTTKK